jgi:hypothetical protein
LFFVVVCFQWFEDKAEQIELMDREFQHLHASIELLVLNRRGSLFITPLTLRFIGNHTLVVLVCLRKTQCLTIFCPLFDPTYISKQIKQLG